MANSQIEGVIVEKGENPLLVVRISRVVAARPVLLLFCVFHCHTPVDLMDTRMSRPDLRDAAADLD